MSKPTQPTPYPEVNALLHELLDRVQAILGSHFIGMCLDGSLASGDFDQDSDIDFVAVTGAEISGDLFAALQAMHERIATIDSWYADQLEGSYMSAHALRRYDPAHVLYPNIERGRGERLKIAQHDEVWNIHRYMLRERGIVLAGPAPQTLIDPVSSDQLRRAMLSVLSGWVTQILHDPTQMKNRGYQSYIVLTLCRILYTLQHGAVVSKPVAARWAQKTLGEQWVPLIERTWAGRHNPGLEASSEDVNETLAFIRYTLERGRRFETHAL
ncbi:MAG: DUF4111 domain-containing protein [Chloroflexi bacterium]|nr:DUF4111 domain-containing protein [Chloroflexota bacterium]